jgi:N-methylhydantoinase B
MLAGGTDIFPAKANDAAWGRGREEPVLDLSAIPELRGITQDPRDFRIGAAVTWSEILAADLPPDFDALRLAAREVGGRQIQNRGTLAGNLCNASPAADGVPPLLCLDAEVELVSLEGSRRLPLSAFLLDNRQTALRPDELVSAILVPRPPTGARSTFLKLGARRYLVISIAMVAAWLRPDAEGKVAEARIAVGACSPVAQRLSKLEADLLGLPLDESLAATATPQHLTPLSPIDDVRASAGYRREAALTLVQRALAQLAAKPLGRVA